MCGCLGRLFHLEAPPSSPYRNHRRLTAEFNADASHDLLEGSLTRLGCSAAFNAVSLVTKESAGDQTKPPGLFYELL
jgi:hypothetical protein